MIMFKAFSILATVVFLVKAVLDWTGYSEADMIRREILSQRNEQRGPE